MYKNFFAIVLLVISINGFAQNMDAYFKSKGVRGLCELSHPSNDLISGEYTVSKSSVDVWIKSKDNVLGGTVTTHLLVYRGSGSLYFNDIAVLYDDDPFAKPFEALKMLMDIIQDMMKDIDPKSFEEMRVEFVRTFGSDVRQWPGKTWAILALNLDYLKYGG